MRKHYKIIITSLAAQTKNVVKLFFLAKMLLVHISKGYTWGKKRLTELLLKSFMNLLLISKWQNNNTIY